MTIECTHKGGRCPHVGLKSRAAVANLELADGEFGESDATVWCDPMTQQQQQRQQHKQSMQASSVGKESVCV